MIGVGDDRPGAVPSAGLSMAAPSPAPTPIAEPDAAMSLSIRRRFLDSLPERRRLLVDMWAALRQQPGDRAARARLSRHLRVLADAAARTGAVPIESAARAADRNLPQALDGNGLLDPLVDATLDAIAAVSQASAPTIAARLTMVMFDGESAAWLDWLQEILVAAGCRVASTGPPSPPDWPTAAGHLVLVDAALATPDRLRQWREHVLRAATPARIVVAGPPPGSAPRTGWQHADGVLPDPADRTALLASLEAELAAMDHPARCVALIGFDHVHADWAAALSAAGFVVVSTGSGTDALRIAGDAGLDALLVGPPSSDEAAIDLARLLAQAHGVTRTEVVRIVAADDDHARLFASGVAQLPGGVSPAAAAAALRERLQVRWRAPPADHDPVSGALRRAPFLLLAQGMLDGPAAYVGIGLIALDGLRAINDRSGRRAGDLALRSLARRLRAALPATAVIGRAGSDEFLFGFTARNEAEARRLMAQAASPPPEVDGEIRLLQSIGGVLLDRDDRAQRLPLAELIARAGELMLDAKSAGGSRIALARYGERPIGERWF